MEIKNAVGKCSELYQLTYQYYGNAVGVNLNLFLTAQAHCEKMFFLIVWAVLSFLCLAHRVSGQVLSSYSIVSLSRTVGPCTLQGGRWIGQWMTTWSTICSSAPHKTQKGSCVICVSGSGNVRRWCGLRLSGTHAVLGRTFLGGWVPMSEMNVRSLVVFSNHSAFHRWSAQIVALLLSL